MPRNYEMRTNRKGLPIDDWKDAWSRVTNTRSISEEAVRTDIKRQHVGTEEPILHVTVFLKCPISAKRIKVPARGFHCKHLQCFDLAFYLKERDRRLLFGDLPIEKHVSWHCPTCKKPLELSQLRVDRYFESILKAYDGLRIVEEVQILSDGTHLPVVQPKAEVIPISESPFLREESTHSDHVEEKPDTSGLQDINDNFEPSSENTDLDLECIKRLPETHQLSKAVKRKMLYEFQRAQKMKKAATPTQQRKELAVAEAGEPPDAAGFEDEGSPVYQSVVGELEGGNNPDVNPDLIDESTLVLDQRSLQSDHFEFGNSNAT